MNGRIGYTHCFGIVHTNFLIEQSCNRFIPLQEATFPGIAEGLLQVLGWA